MTSEMTHDTTNDTTELIEGYLGYLAENGRKDLTIRTYRRSLAQCLRALEDGGRATSPYDLDADDFRWLFHNMTQKEETRRAYMRTLSLFCRHYTGRDPMRSANILFNREQRDRVFIDDEDFTTLYENAGPTMRMVIVLGACMGLRRAEICSIRDEDIRGGYIVVHGKGHGDGLRALCRMPALVAEEIDRYREWKATRENSGDGYLVQNGPVLSRASTEGLSNTFGQYARRLGVRATLHSLRRYYATTLYYQTGSDITTVSRLMRHADSSTTIRCYIGSDDTREREAVGRLSEHVSAVLGASACAP